MSGPDREAFTAGYDEDRDAQGGVRAGYVEALEALDAADLGALSREVSRRLGRLGVSFGADPFVVDPVPRLISAAEWDPLAAGLAQRARALNCFLRDAYGERRIVREGVVAAALIDEAEGYEPDLLGRLPGQRWPAAVIGFDVVRDPDGEFLVLEDNMRTPSGLAYALAARAALTRALPPGFPRPRPIDPAAYELLGAALRAAAPPGRDGDGDGPCVVVLTDGPDNVAHYEHAQIAEHVGATLATLDDLAPDGDGLRLRAGGGDRTAARRVDVVYRRTNDDELRDARGEPTAVARALLRPWLRGEIGLVNAFGNGAGDDKFVHSVVEDCVRFYLDEEPLVRSVPAHALDVSSGPPSLDELRRLVVKPRNGYGGNGVVVGAHADTADLERLATSLAENPEHYIAQPIIALSRHPTVVDGRLQPRHIDLRAFAFCGAGDDVALMDGGLTRVALAPGALVVNSSQQGGGKDTWVVD